MEAAVSVDTAAFVHLEESIDRLMPSPSPDPISEFYSRHPYPPPVDNLDRARDEWRDPNRQRAEFHLFWPHRSYVADLDILVAGCGTWQAAKYALCRPRVARRRASTSAPPASSTPSSLSTSTT